MFLSPISRCSPVVECHCRSTDADSLFARSTQSSLPRSSTARALADVLHCSDPYLLPFYGRPIFDCDVSDIRSPLAATDLHCVAPSLSSSSSLRSDVSSRSGAADLPDRRPSRPSRIPASPYETADERIPRMVRASAFTKLPDVSHASTSAAAAAAAVIVDVALGNVNCRSQFVAPSGNRNKYSSHIEDKCHRYQIVRERRVITSRRLKRCTWSRTSRHHQMALPTSAPLYCGSLMHSYTTTLYRAGRGRHSYGLTLTGGRPCVVGVIDPCGSAAKAGLRTGDIISRVNGHRVLDANTDCLARIIRHCKELVTVEVKRHPVSVAPTPAITNSTTTSSSHRRGVAPPFADSDCDTDCSSGSSMNSNQSAIITDAAVSQLLA